MYYYSFTLTYCKNSIFYLLLKVAKALVGGYSSRQRKSRQYVPILAERESRHDLITTNARPRVCVQCRKDNKRTSSGRIRETAFACEQCKINLHK